MGLAKLIFLWMEACKILRGLRILTLFYSQDIEVVIIWNPLTSLW